MFCKRLLTASLMLSCLLAVGCGGGGGGGDGGGADALPPAPQPPGPEQLDSASRLTARGTLGMPFADIEAIAATGEEAWLERQFALPVGSHQAVVDELQGRLAAGELVELERQFGDPRFLFRRLAWWQQEITAPDVLRQRIALALSEILVVSDRVDDLAADPYALSNYYDTLLEHAFGNYRDLLRAVTLHPAMGIYLSHINNAPADPQNNTYPDENYAREVMQLFTIGLFELNPDGSEKLDAAGDPVPTYDSDDIREFARVFTGLSFDGPNARFWGREPEFRRPMRMFDAYHDSAEKVLLNGVTLPAGQGGLQDVDAAIDNLFHHPNVGPFIGRQLIQRLVTSNPSPAYVARVAAAFNGDEGGSRGDMRALIRAILLDPEARAAPGTDPEFGKLREPLLRVTALLRQFHAASPDGFYANTGYYLEELLLQHPLSSPSVFNFFLPAHSPVGEIADAGLVAPEFQITNSNTVVGVSNVADLVLLGEVVNDLDIPPFQGATLDLGEYLALAEDIGQLLDRLDRVMTYGTLQPATREVIEQILPQIDDLAFRVQAAIYLIFVSPDYAVQL